MIALLRAIFREKYPTKGESHLLSMVDNVISGRQPIETYQWRKIIEKMYDEQDFGLLEQ